VSYAKARGVRVLPEWDVPGHGDWGAIPGIMGCSDVLDPTQDAVYEALSVFLGEMGGIFTDEWMFLGGDEVDSTCWDRNPAIAAWLQAHGMTSSQLQQYFWQQMEVRVLPKLNKTIGVWEADGLQISLGSLAPGMFVNVYQSLATSNRTVWANKTTVVSIAGNWWCESTQHRC
jgi:hexosaminidase